jgi:hypothetical protein
LGKIVGGNLRYFGRHFAGIVAGIKKRYAARR